MKIIDTSKMFIFDQIKFQNLLLNRKDTLDWWNQLNQFIINSRRDIKIEGKFLYFFINWFNYESIIKWLNTKSKNEF